MPAPREEKTGTGDTGSKPRPPKAEGSNWGQEATVGKMRTSDGELAMLEPEGGEPGRRKKHVRDQKTARGGERITVGPLHMNLHVVNFQKRKRAIHQHQVWVKLQLALHLYCWQPFSSTISRLLSLLQSVTFLTCSLDASPQYAGCYTVLLYFSNYCTVGLKFFSLFLCLPVFHVLFGWRV